MIKWVWTIVVLTGLSSTLALLPAAELDEVQAHLLSQYPLPLRWENIEGRPEWVAGPRPRYRHDVQMHVVELVPGCAFTFRVPSEAAIRVVNPCGSLGAHDVEIGISDGSGLYAYLPATSSSDGQALLVEPGWGDPLLGRVVRPATCTTPVCIAVFVSRPDPLGEIAPYRCLIPFGKPGVKLQYVFDELFLRGWLWEQSADRLRRSDQAGKSLFWKANPDSPLQVDVQGPFRLAVQTRLRYPPDEARRHQTYRVHVQLGQTVHSTLDYQTTLEDRYPILVNGKIELLSKLEVAHVEIPPGKHTLSFAVTAPLYLQILSQRQPDYLAPGHNQPRFATTFGPGNVLHHEVTSKEQLALNLVRDNRQREGGLAGAMLLRDLAAKRLDYPRVRQVADKLEAQHTFYRDLLPVRKLTSQPQTAGWFVSRRLLNPGEKGLTRLVPPQHREEMLDQLGLGTFVTLPTGEVPLVYSVPERFGPSLIRIITNRRDMIVPVEFFVQVGSSPPRRLQLLPVPELTEAAFLPSATETALATLPGPAEKRTLLAPFASWRRAAPLLSVGVVELPLPTAAREVKVWGAPGAIVRVALQYRAGKPFQLSEMQYLVGMEQWSHGGWEKELNNHREPFFRMLHQADRLFRASVIAPPAPKPAAPIANEAALVRQAQQEEKDRQWLASLTTWTRLLPGASGDTRRLAIFGRVIALQELGEAFIADRLLRSLFLFDADARIRHEAMERLAQTYRRSRDRDALVGLYSVEILRRSNAGTLADLAELLVAEGEYDLALQAGLAIDAPARPVRTLVRAAFQIRWWQLFRTLIKQLPADEKCLWLAQRALVDGDEKQALLLAARAGGRGRPFAAHLVRGQSIRAGLFSADKSARARALIEWMRWQAEHPGPHLWREDFSLVIDAHGNESVYSIDRDLLARFAVATTTRPVKLRVFGPARLRLEVRPVHAKGSKTPIEDWLSIRGTGQQRFVAVTNNFPAEGLALTSDADQVPGIKVESELEVGPGLHELDIAGEKATMLVRVSSWRPELPVSVLPSLAWESVAGVLRGAPLPEPRPAGPDAAEAMLVARGDLAGVLKLPVGEDDAAVVRRMTILVRLVETRPKQAAQALAVGEVLFASHRHIAELADLRSRLIRKSSWSLVTLIRDSAGIRRVPVEGWNPESAALRARQALLGPLLPAEQIVAGYDRFVLSIDALRSTQVTLDLTAAELGLQPLVPLTVLYQLDEQAPRKLLLKPEAARQTVMLDVAAGRHGVRIWIEQPVANQFLRVRIVEKGKDLIRPLERVYQVATKAQPVQLAVEGPTWLRIDELREGVTRVRYQFLERELQTITLSPEKGQPEALFRVFQRVVAPRERQVVPRHVPATPVPVPPAVIPFPLSEKPLTGFALFNDAWALGIQEDGTWSLAGGYRQRRALNEDFRTLGGLAPDLFASAPDEFFEQSLTHRYYNEWCRTYFETQFLVRERERSGPTVGLRHHLRYDPVDSPWTFHLEGSIYAQPPGGAIIPDTGNVEWSGLLRGRIAQYRQLTPTFAHEPSVMVFGRYMSLLESRYQPGRVDQDIFTPYKADHRVGWAISDTLTWQPWLDTEWWGGWTVQSNEDFVTPDHVALRLGWRQLFGSMQMDTSYRLIQFFKDQDRQQALMRHLFDIELNCELWCGKKDRVEVAVGAEYELTRRAGGLNLFLTWHYGNGRFYRDFRPDAVSFRELRRRRAAENAGHNILTIGE